MTALHLRPTVNRDRCALRGLPDFLGDLPNCIWTSDFTGAFGAGACGAGGRTYGGGGGSCCDGRRRRRWGGSSGHGDAWSTPRAASLTLKLPSSRVVFAAAVRCGGRQRGRSCGARARCEGRRRCACGGDSDGTASAATVPCRRRSQRTTQAGGRRRGKPHAGLATRRRPPARSRRHAMRCDIDPLARTRSGGGGAAASRRADSPALRRAAAAGCRRDESARIHGRARAHAYRAGRCRRLRPTAPLATAAAARWQAHRRHSRCRATNAPTTTAPTTSQALSQAQCHGPRDGRSEARRGPTTRVPSGRDGATRPRGPPWAALARRWYGQCNRTHRGELAAHGGSRPRPQPSRARRIAGSSGRGGLRCHTDAAVL